MPSDASDREPLDGAAADFFEMSLDHLCVTGFDGYFIRVNPSWSRTLGWTIEELLGLPTIDFVHPDDRDATIGARARLHDGSPMGPLVNRYRCKDGSYRWFEWRSIADRDRRVVYAAARDITEQKEIEENLRAARAHEAQLERQLVVADRMASVGTLAAGAAHEINNPLASVMANLELMLETLAKHDGPLRTELTAMAQDALAGADTIRQVMHGLKTFARAPVERRVVLELPRVLDLAVSLTANLIAQRARLVKAYAPAPAVEADEARLGQVFVNLLVNAAHAIPERDGGDHEIRIVLATDEAGRAVVEVRDTGVGIPASALDRVFDPFFTTKQIGTGTGLGLSICHNVVVATGGTITVTSEEGRGSVFRVVLPPAAGRHLRTAPPVVMRAPSASRAKVLVVDDDVLVGKAFQRALGDHEVTVVTSGRDALTRLARDPGIDVILSDLMMPEMSGMELFEELAQRFPELTPRVVFISGGAFTNAARSFLERVPNERFDKPIDAEMLRSIVRRFAS